MQRNVVGFALLLVFLTSSASAQSPEPTWVTGEGFTGVILHDTRLYHWVYGEELPGWDLTAEDVALLEAALPQFLATSDHPQAAAVLEQLPTYGRQYSGFVLGKERRIIANYFCWPEDQDEWLQPIVVDDGGSCFFQIQYIPSTNQFDNLYVNGPG